MKNSMLKLSTLSAAVLSASTAMAGGFDNSDRSLDILFGNDNVITTSYGQTSVPMKATVEQRAGSGSTLQSGDVVDNFTRPQVAVRYNITDDISCATKYEQPYAASVAYQDDSLAYVDATGGESAPISTTYESESVTAVCGYDFALSTGELKVFGGPKIQKVNGAFDEDLHPTGSPLTGAADNLTVQLDGGTEVGYVFGAAFSIPEIALRASLTYHSQVDYDAEGSLTAIFPSSNVGIGLATGTQIDTTAKAKTFTPQSVEIALQSGIAENTLASLTMRWTEYSKLAELDVTGGDADIDGTFNTHLMGVGTGNGDAITLQQLAAVDEGANSLINPTVGMFSNDTFDYSLGLGRRINDQLSLGTSFSGSIKLGGKEADTPLGADSTSLRLPGDTSHTLSFGGEYTLLPGMKVNGGFGYTFINAYVVQEKDNTFKAEFSKTEATSFQVGVSYEI